MSPLREVNPGPVQNCPIFYFSPESFFSGGTLEKVINFILTKWDSWFGKNEESTQSHHRYSVQDNLDDQGFNFEEFMKRGAEQQNYQLRQQTLRERL